MAKQHAEIYLSTRSLEDLEASKGVQILIRLPEKIEALKKEIDETEKIQLETALKIGDLHAELEALKKAGFFTKLFKGKELADKEAKLASEIKSLQGKVKVYTIDLDNLKKEKRGYMHEYDEFVKVLANINVEVKDVLEAYEQIKTMLEQRANAPAEPVVEAEPVIEQPAVVPAEPEKPKNPQLAKFERRMQKFKEMQAKQKPKTPSGLGE